MGIEPIWGIRSLSFILSYLYPVFCVTLLQLNEKSENVLKTVL